VRLAVLFLLVGAVGAFHYPSIVSEDRTPQELAEELELFTIVGDFANPKERPAPGRWRLARQGNPARTFSEEEREKLSELAALPYVAGARKAPEVISVTVHDPDRAYDGLNLYTSGHEPAAFIMDMRGRVLYRWFYDISMVWPDVQRTIQSHFWRRAHWYPNGDILAIFEGTGIIKLDRNSELLWAYKGGCHHEAAVADNGNIYILTRKPEIRPEINKQEYVLPDGITVLSPDGEVVAEYPLLEAFRNSDFEHLLMSMRPRGDLMHTNSIKVFDGSLATLSEYYKHGNILISSWKIDTIAILDPEIGQVVWAESGRSNDMWRKQHDPTVLSDGNVLLFDNMGHNGKSRVLEFDPDERKVVWQFAGGEADELDSRTCGASRMLLNVNSLITESDNGRALEVTRDGEVVWEFFSPHRAGEDDELIATLFEMVRVDKDYFPWLQVRK